MSSIEASTDLSQVYRSFQDRLVRYLPESSEWAWVILQSTAVAQVSYATVKNIPYAFLSREMGTYDFSHFLSARVTYFESMLHSCVSIVHNLFFTVVYAALSFGTFGLSDSFNYSCRMHWHHFTYSLAAVAIATVGVVTPYWGACFNVWILSIALDIVKRSYSHDVHLFERPLLDEIKKLFKEHSGTIYNYTREKVKSDANYHKWYKPSLEYIEQKISSAERMDDLISLGKDVRDQWPKVGLLDTVAIDSNSENSASTAVHKHYV